MHNYDDKYPTRPAFEPGTSRLQAPVDTNEPSGPAHMPGAGSRGLVDSQVLGQEGVLRPAPRHH